MLLGPPFLVSTIWLAVVLLTLAVLVANMTFLLYGSSGLETMLQTGLLLCCAIVAIEHVIPEGEIGADLGKARVLSGLAAAGALLTRLDSAVLIATWFLATLWQVWGSSDSAAGPDAATGQQGHSGAQRGSNGGADGQKVHGSAPVRDDEKALIAAVEDFKKNGAY